MEGLKQGEFRFVAQPWQVDEHSTVDRARRDGSGSPLLELIGAKLAELWAISLTSNMENGGGDDYCCGILE